MADIDGQAVGAKREREEEEETEHKHKHHKHEEDEGDREEGSDTELDACCGSKHGGKASQVPVLSLRPTQLAVGMYQVSFKVGRLKQMLKDGSLQGYLRSHPVPVVEGPGGGLYMTDHHHLASALVKLAAQVDSPKDRKKGRSKPCIEPADKALSRDWSKEKEESPKFWEDLIDKQCAWAGHLKGSLAVGKDGQPRVRYEYEMLSPADMMPRMPSTVTGLQDDPYRSLAAYVRYAKGYSKPRPSAGGNEQPEFFVEFKWAQYLLGKMGELQGEPDNARVLEAALDYAKSPDAADLPGYIGDKKNKKADKKDEHDEGPIKQQDGGRPARALHSRVPAAAPPAAPAAPATGTKPAVTSSWPCKGGELVRVLQQGPSTGSEQHQVTIVLDSSFMIRGKGIAQGSTVELHWGVYRSSPHLWQHPAAVTPEGSTKDERSGAMRSAMAPSSDGSVHSITLSVPAELAPLTLGFVLRVSPPPGADGGTRPDFITPLRGRHFSALIGCSAGSATQPGPLLLPPPPAPPGAAWPAAAGAAPSAAGKARGRAVVDTAPGAAAERHRPVNFAVRCRGAERVCLVLLRPQDGGEWGMVELVLDPVLNRSGELWHIAVEGLHSLEGLCYGWRLEGDVSWESGSRVQPYQLLLDPCCPSLRYFPAGPAAEGSPLPLPTVELPDGSKAAALSSLDGLAADAAWQATAAAAPGGAPAGQQEFVPGPDHALEDLRVMEVDVRTFARGKEVQHPGTYLGVAERAAHIRAVGANAVVITPCYATAKGIGLLSRAAVHLMAADPALARDGSTSVAAAAEFRSMVSQLHAAGIEVYLMLELTFTAEGTDSHPNPLSLRGLDYGSYYRSNGVLNCGDASMRQYLLRVLQHWAGEGVDGFCFINAENLVQDREGTVLDAPPLADAICHDPLLRRLKLVALASDDTLLPRGGVRGFPHWGLWQQRNTAFGADLMAFLAEGTLGLLTTVAGRLTGSASIFDSDWDAGLPGNLAIGRRPSFAMNSITVLGRQSLAELAAEAAELAAAACAAEAAQGLGGVGGAPPSAATVAKSLLALAVLSLGVPIIPQDTVADLAAARFVGVLMRLRSRLAPLLLPPRFDSPRDIRWHSALDPLVEPIWDAELAAEAVAAGQRSINYLAFSVRSTDGQAVYVGINPHPHAVPAFLPTPPPGRVWERVIDTSLPPPDDALLEGGQPVRSTTYQVNSKAVVVLQAAVLETSGLQRPPGQLPA
ncbi:hypothetical protein ABPG75_011457 [Micractinium tetrahymenae]